MKTIFNSDKLKGLYLALCLLAFSTTAARAQGLIGFENETEIFTTVDEMPRFYDKHCEQLNDDERKPCAETALFAYLKKNLNYPAIAIERKTEGIVYVKFVVNEDGRISNIETVKDIGDNCGAEATKLLADMPDWIPGVQNGQKVKVYYTLPVKFQLK